MIVDPPEIIERVGAQIDRIRAVQPQAVLGGSVGREAFYEDLGFSSPPYSFRDSTRSRLGGFRDLDLVFTDFRLYSPDDAGLMRLSPMMADPGLGAFIRHTSDGLCYLAGETTDGDIFKVRVEPEVLRAVARPFLGRTVLTFTTGTQAWVERMLPGEGKYEQSRELFTRFVAHARAVAPQEFLPDELYEPFRVFMRRNHMRRPAFALAAV